MTSDQRALTLPVLEGVHLRMPDAVYFDVDALGSTDMKALYWDAPSWWAQSRHNRNRKITRGAYRRSGKDLGAALHVLVIQGGEAYEAAYAIEPDDGRPDWLRTRDQIRDALRERGVEIPRGDFSDATINRLVRKHGLAHKVFDTARLDYEAARRAGRLHVSEDEDRRLRYTAALIHEDQQLGAAFSGGLGEVAVFWRREDDPSILLRAKFDYIRRRRIFDLKKIGNSRGRDPDTAIRIAIDDYDYDVQRRLYPEAWERMAAFVAAGQVHGWAQDGAPARVLQHERETLEAIVGGGTPEWCWVFVQLPVDDVGQERGAVVAPRFHLPEGRFWDSGGRKIETALGAYRKFRDAFTLERPWRVVQQAYVLTDDDVRAREKKEIV